MSDQTTPSFDTPGLAEVVERLDRAVIDALPFGTIHLNSEGRVDLFSASEARLSGFEQAKALGAGFFTGVAPCFAKAGFLERIERAKAAGKIDIEFEHVGDFNDAEKELRCRILSARDGGLWIFLQRL